MNNIDRKSAGGNVEASVTLVRVHSAAVHKFLSSSD